MQGRGGWGNIVFRGMLPSILGNIAKHSGECRKTFQGNILKHSEERRQTFREMFQDSLNLNFDLLCQILLIFYQILLLNCYKTKEKTQSCPPNTRANLLKKTFSTLLLVTNLLSLDCTKNELFHWGFFQ